MIPTITEECFQFLKESNGKYLIKNLPRDYMGFTKVKVRIRKQKNDFINGVNKAFESKRHEFYGSSIFAYSSEKLLTEESGKEPFYVFPIDGYKFVYNPQVSNIDKELNVPDLKGMVSDIVNVSYKTDKLNEALSEDCEILVYNVPYYYAVRKSLVQDYRSFFYEL